MFSLKICPSKRSRESSFVRERTQDQCYLSNSECLLAVKYSDVFFLILPNIVFFINSIICHLVGFIICFPVCSSLTVVMSLPQLNALVAPPTKYGVGKSYSSRLLMP